MLGPDSVRLWPFILTIVCCLCIVNGTIFILYSSENMLPSTGLYGHMISGGILQRMFSFTSKHASNFSTTLCSALSLLDRPSLQTGEH